MDGHEDLPDWIKEARSWSGTNVRADRHIPGSPADRPLRRFTRHLVFIGCGLLLGVLGALLLSAFKSELRLRGLVAALGLGAGVLLALFVLQGCFGLMERSVSVRVAAAAGWVRQGLNSALVFGMSCSLPCLLLVAAEAFGPPEGYVKRIGARAEEREKVVAQEADQQRKRIEEREKRAARQAEEQEKMAAREADEQRKRAEREAEERKRQAEEAARENEKRSKDAADFIVGSSGVPLIAIQMKGVRSSPQFVVCAKEPDERAGEFLARAWKARIPVLGNEAALPLARRLFVRCAPGQTIQGDDASSLFQLAQFRWRVPTNTTLVAFLEKGSDQRRAGHLLKDMDDRFVFCDLVPKARLVRVPVSDASSPDESFQTETLSRREHVQPGSDVQRLTERSLKGSADCLEYLLYGMLARLQAKTTEGVQWPIRPCLFVHRVTVEHNLQVKILQQLKQDVKAGRSELARALEDLKRTEGGFRSGNWLADIIQTVAEYRKEKERELHNRQLSEEIRSLREEEFRSLTDQLELLEGLFDTRKWLKKDIHRLLSRADVAIVERADHATGFYATVSEGEKWVRPKAEDAIPDGLVHATHLLLTEIDKPHHTGTYHLAMRLVDVRTGEIVWADNGDHLIPGKQFFVPRTKSSTGSGDAATIAGRWRCPGTSAVIEVKETNDRIHVSLVSHAFFERFELFARRRGRQCSVTSCYVTFKDDRFSRQHAISAEMKVIDESHLELSSQRAIGMGRVGVMFGPLEKVVFEKE